MRFDPMRPNRFVAAVAVAACLLTTVNALARSTNVAVAANFTDAAKEIAEKLKAKTGHD
jgi:molybdate transport system substrate-binding protein